MFSLGMSVDLSPHYYLNLQSFLRAEQSSALGRPGPSQGLNTGVVLYQLERMRNSEEYNKYLELESLQTLHHKYQYKSVSI